MKAFLVALVLALLFFGCAIVYTKHEARLMVFKTSKLSYADAGFVHSNKDEIHLEILMAGQAAFILDIGNKICLNSVCMSKKEFNAKYLCALYPNDILNNIFLGKAIFNGKNRVAFEEGFEQELFLEEGYDISYRVQNDTIRFKDTINNILIRSRKI